MRLFSRLQTYFEMLKTDPLGFVIYLVYFAVVILLSLILHECGHAYAAYRCGDPTAKMLGRLTLNPAKHLDPIGTVCMVLFGFGWAKPVPVNPRNFRNYRKDDLIVSVAGIAVNLILFITSLALAVGLNHLLWKDSVYQSFVSNKSVEQLMNPYTSSIGAWITYADDTRQDITFFLERPWLVLYVQRFLLMMSVTNLGLAVFNLLPVPPLDGYHLLNDLVLKGRFSLDSQAFRIAHIVLIALLFTGALSGLLSTVNRAVYGGVLHVFLMITGAA